MRKAGIEVNGFKVFLGVQTGQTPENWEATYRLLEAAPDLLDALELFVRWTEREYPTWDLPEQAELAGIVQGAMDALAKARGE